MLARRKKADGTEKPQRDDNFLELGGAFKALCTISVYIILTGTYGFNSKKKRKKKQGKPLKF